MWKKVPFCLKPLNIWLGCILGYSCPSTEKMCQWHFQSIPVFPKLGPRTPRGP